MPASYYLLNIAMAILRRLGRSGTVPRRLWYTKKMFSVFVFLFGLAVGSFLNSVIFRLAASEEASLAPMGRKQGKSAFVGRSSCPKCAHALAWYDLIPLLSFVLLQGKCRYCKKQISWQYPIVEISTAAVFLLIFNAKFLISNQFLISNFLNFSLLYFWIIASFLIIIFVYDLKYYLIPDSVVYSGIGVTFLYRVFEIWNFGNWDLFWNLEFGIWILAPLFFLAIYLLSRGRWLGFGDVKLAILMGLFLGWPNILIALFCAFFLGALVGVSLVLSGKKAWKSQVPFGPFLIAGTFVALFWGKQLMDFYLHWVLV